MNISVKHLVIPKAVPSLSILFKIVNLREMLDLTLSP